MGAWGAIIMSFFGSFFASLTLYWQNDIKGLALAAPFLVFAAIALAAVHVLRLPGAGFVPSERAEKAIMWSSIGEGLGLFAAGQTVMSIHRPELLLPAMALVVGLHFLPIAWSGPFRPFYLLGGALILAAILGFSIASPTGGTIAGLGGALGLWTAAVAAVVRDREAKLGAAAIA
jgi:hypothetical protein